VTEPRSYHGQPVLKAPVWSWEIPCYFFAGGTAGASAGLAWLAGARGNEVLARKAWAVALTGIAVSPPLLISDLGRPERFLNMMRMFKVTSPMSVGSWILSGAGASTALAAVGAQTGWFPRSAAVARPTAALLGLPLATYTAALLGNTAVPVWHEARLLLPFVFGSGAAMSAGAAASVLTPVRHAAPARRLAIGGAVAELALSEVMHRSLGEQGEPYRRGTPALLSKVSSGCIAGGAALLARAGSRSRAAAVTGGVLICAGAFSSRWSVFKAGIASAADPRYVVGPQRARLIDVGGCSASG
jgi:hypothetical protein